MQTGLEANLRFPGKESCETKILEGYQHGKIGYLIDLMLQVFVIWYRH